MRSFRHLKPGDAVTRLLSSEKIPMPVIVQEVTDETIVCRGGWVFDRADGVEIDHELGWGPEYGITGSVLNPSEAKEEQEGDEGG